MDEECNHPRALNERIQTFATNIARYVPLKIFFNA